MTLRNPVETALNALHVALRKGVEYYRDSAELAQEPSLAGLLRELARRREQQAEELEQHIREVGLPRMPDPERQTIGQVVTRLKTALSDDPEATLVQAQLPVEQEIGQTAIAALQEELSDKARQFVRALMEDLTRSQDQLANLGHPFRPS